MLLITSSDSTEEMIDMKTSQILAIGLVVALVIAGVAIVVIHNENEKNKPHEITDMQGNVVTVPAKINRVAITSQSPMVPVYTYYMNGVDTLVGANSAGIAYAKNGIMGKIYNFDDINTGFVSGTTVNVESLTALDPQVVIYTGNRTDEHTLLDNAGLTNVGFNTAMTGGNSTDPFETIECWLKLLKDMMGDNGRADKLIDYNNNAKASVAEKVKDIAAGDKPKVLIIFSIDQNTSKVKVAGSGQYSEYWIEKAGGINVAASVKGLADVNMETIEGYNPDYIFFANSSGKMPSNLINNDIPGMDWSGIKAVQDKHVYVFPSATYFSYAPSLEAGVTLQFIAKILHPDVFSSLDINNVAKDFFKEMFNYTATNDDVSKFLYPDPLSVKLH